MDAVTSDSVSHVFFFSSIGDGRCFFGRFLTNTFAVVTVAKLSRSVVRHGLDYGGFGSSRGGVVADIVSRFFIVLLFLVLNILLCVFTTGRRVTIRGDSRLFPLVTANGCFPTVINVLFVVNLVSSTCSTTNSTLATLAASFAMSVLKAGNGSRRAIIGVHGGIRVNVTIIVKVAVFMFGLLGGADIVSTMCVLTDCACNPVLNLFTFNVFVGRRIHSGCVPLITVTSPILYFVLRGGSRT